MAQISINSLLGDDGPAYSEIKVAPYRKELVQAGFIELLTPDDVDQALNRQDDKIVLVVLNSVCGCSARTGRPGTILSLFNKVIPDELVTLFAGMEKNAVAHFRQNYLSGQTPSSPNIALFKNGQLVYILHRYQIERMDATQISNELKDSYNKVCTLKQSVDAEASLRSHFMEKYQEDPLQLPTE
jgi:putative YphP/YqiW family bacilliredoxin